MKTKPTPTSEIVPADVEREFDKLFVWKDYENKPDDPNTQAWTIRGSFPAEVKIYLAKALKAQDERSRADENYFTDNELEYIYDYLESSSDGESIRPIFLSIEKKIRVRVERYRKHDEKRNQ